jgi:hypothetical protein
MSIRQIARELRAVTLRLRKTFLYERRRRITAERRVRDLEYEIYMLKGQFPPEREICPNCSRTQVDRIRCYCRERFSKQQ